MASLGLRMKFKKTLFMSDEEKHGHHFDLPLFFNMSKKFLAPRVWVMNVFKLVSCKPAASRPYNCIYRDKFLNKTGGCKSCENDREGMWPTWAFNIKHSLYFILNFFCLDLNGRSVWNKSSNFSGRWSKTQNGDQNQIYYKIYYKMFPFYKGF